MVSHQGGSTCNMIGNHIYMTKYSGKWSSSQPLLLISFKDKEMYSWLLSARFMAEGESSILLLNKSSKIEGKEMKIERKESSRP